MLDWYKQISDKSKLACYYDKQLAIYRYCVNLFEYNSVLLVDLF